MQNTFFPDPALVIMLQKHCSSFD